MAIRETLEREVKLRAAARVQAARARRRADRAPPLRLHLPRHGRLPARPSRHHAAPPRREREGALAAEAAAGQRAGSSSRPRAGPARRRTTCWRCSSRTFAAPRSSPIARLRTRREGVRADGAEVVHDTVAVLDHQRVTRSFEELEVELIDGDEKALRRIEKELRRAGADGRRDAARRCSRLSTSSSGPSRPASPTTSRAPRRCAPAFGNRSSACSPTIRARGSGPNPRSCTRCESRRDGSGHFSGPAASYSIPRGRSPCGTS